MILYICNRCRKTIEKKKNVILVQTKIGEETSTAHLCRTCHDYIKGLCSTGAKKVVNPNKDGLSEGAQIMKAMLEYSD